MSGLIPNVRLWPKADTQYLIIEAVAVSAPERLLLAESRHSDLDKPGQFFQKFFRPCSCMLGPLNKGCPMGPKRANTRIPEGPLLFLLVSA